MVRLEGYSIKLLVLQEGIHDPNQLIRALQMRQMP